MSQNLGPLSPLSHNVTLHRPPPPPLTCDVIYGCPLISDLNSNCLMPKPGDRRNFNTHEICWKCCINNERKEKCWMGRRWKNRWNNKLIIRRCLNAEKCAILTERDVARSTADNGQDQYSAFHSVLAQYFYPRNFHCPVYLLLLQVNSGIWCIIVIRKSLLVVCKVGFKTIILHDNVVRKHWWTTNNRTYMLKCKN